MEKITSFCIYPQTRCLINRFYFETVRVCVVKVSENVTNEKTTLRWSPPSNFRKRVRGLSGERAS